MNINELLVGTSGRHVMLPMVELSHYNPRTIIGSPDLEPSFPFMVALIEAMRRGDEIPPIVLVTGFNCINVVDGNHRIVAAREAGVPTISALIFKKGREAINAIRIISWIAPAPTSDIPTPA